MNPLTPDKILRNLTNGYYMSPKEQEETADYIKQLQESNEILKASMIEFAETIFELKRELNNFKPPFELTDAGADTNIEPFTLHPKGSGMVALNQPELDQLKAVLCDPNGKCCIDGSDEDRAIVDRALQALAKPDQEPEPSAWVTDDFAITYTAEVAQRWRDKGWKVVPFYTAPPPKEWVGLTDDERNTMIGRIQHDQYTRQRDLIGKTQIITEMYLKERNT